MHGEAVGARRPPSDRGGHTELERSVEGPRRRRAAAADPPERRQPTGRRRRRASGGAALGLYGSATGEPRYPPAPSRCVLRPSPAPPTRLQPCVVSSAPSARAPPSPRRSPRGRPPPPRRPPAGTPPRTRPTPPSAAAVAAHGGGRPTVATPPPPAPTPARPPRPSGGRL
ncbi:hypothetical protein BU14_0381s0019 [Porphyra umbilicalis]|uniref:Uncharacterized protein n=1 Tax=Porphyra umbilicalis TaxID=2786 RepID=A0A1X6NWV7_PORUM|nr:hypothetical protein BU14_0381s0019 [Porphyra umbilicalis]|eukprot:OSX73078.1 hypothetical protein BU14_0381s0019 [Porphyra umbilicalis]